MAMLITKFHKLIESKIVWALVVILVVIAFVVVGTQLPTKNPAQERIAGKLFGKEVSQQEYSEAYRYLYVWYSLRMGRPIPQSDRTTRMLQDMSWKRLAALRKAEKMGMQATDDEIVEAITSFPLFQQNGQFDPTIYKQIIASFISGFGMNEKDLERLFADQLLISKMEAIPQQSVMVTDQEILEAFHLATDKITVESANIPRSLSTSPTVDETGCKTYYEQNKESFRRPERALANYVQFSVSNYLDSVMVQEEQISNYYEQNKERYAIPLAEDAPEDTATEYKPLEEVKEEVTNELKERLAREKAATEADLFVAALSQNPDAGFKATAEKLEVPCIDNAPSFTQADKVQGVDPTAPFARTAFSLDPNSRTHFYSDPVIGKEAVYVIELTKKLPSNIPPYESIQAEVRTAAEQAAAQIAYAEKVKEVHSAIKDAVKAGTAFADAIAPYNMELKPSVTFSMMEPAETQEGYMLMQYTLHLAKGDLSEPIRTANEFVVAYVADKVLGDEENDLPGLREELIANIKNEKNGQLIQAWYDELLNEANFENLMAKDVADQDAAAL